MKTGTFILFLLVISAKIGAQQPDDTKMSDPEGTLPSVEELLTKAENALAQIKDYTGTMVKQERFGKEVQKNILQFKFAQPFKVYIKYVEPFKGREAIYVRGANDGEVKVHKGSFPDVTMNFDTRGSWAMEGNHHPVTSFGLGTIIQVNANNMRKALKRNEGTFQVSETQLFGKPAWKIEVAYPQGGTYVNAKEDETLWDIEKRTGQDMFLILYINQDYDEPDDPDEGDRVFIPRYYGAKTEFILSKETFLPLKAATWDWNGHLYESYEFPELKLNIGLGSKDFDPDNSAYNF